MYVIAITGANGFIGTHLLDLLSDRDDIQIKILIHKNSNFVISNRRNISTFRGDLLDPETLNGFFDRGCVVVNLVYLSGRTRQENLEAMTNLAEACAKAKIFRLLHCSTAVIAGRVSTNVVTENTACNPINEYEITKLELEKLVLEKSRDKFETVILRPTAVFGPGGKNLLKLANDLRKGNRMINYLRSSLYNTRRMNLVYVSNVVSAIEFLIRTKNKIDNEVFIISDDEYSGNNYRYIENYLIKNLGYGNYLIPTIPIPAFVLKILLKLSRKSNINPSLIYDCHKLHNIGFKKSTSLEDGLADFVYWYKNRFYSDTEYEINENFKC